MYSHALKNALKLVSMIKLLYSYFRSKVICGQYLTADFERKRGIKEGCILSPFLFALTIDWVMKEKTLGTKASIKWTFTETLDDLDFADDISLLSHCYGDRHPKQKRESCQKFWVNRIEDKQQQTKTLRNNRQTANPITSEGHIIEEVTAFTYLGVKVTKVGNLEYEVKARISKARRAFAALKTSARPIRSATEPKFVCSRVIY